MSNKAAGPTAAKAAQAVAPKSTPPKQNASMSAAQAANKMHKRSRSGCFTCRLRRKKCDEGKPHCKACRHLGLKCEYKRPLWWSNNEQRRSQKEMIKNIIKRTKLSEKTSKDANGTGADSPPGLTHSLPTSATYSDPNGRTRAQSEDSNYSFDFNAGHHPHVVAGVPYDPIDIYAPQVYTPQFDAHFGNTYPNTPYEVDIKTERQTYVNGEPTRRDSSISTFSTFHPPSHHHNHHHSNTLSTVPEGDDDFFTHEDIYDTPDVDHMFAQPPHSDDLDFGYFDFQHAPPPPATSTNNTTEQATIQVDDCDQYLLEHFVQHVLSLIFPVLEASQPGSPRADSIIHALSTNKCYLHCCLSIAGIHLKSLQPASSPGQQQTDEEQQLDADIVRHRYATVSELCEALKRDVDHAQILEATLGMMFFNCSVGRADDVLPDIPWHQHFTAASSLVRKLELPEHLLLNAASAPAADAGADPSTATPSSHPHHHHPHHNPHHHALVPHSPPNFNMTLTAWIDILGATMLGRAPAFANTYRELHLSSTSTGLLELMGCEDRLMYLISEIACLEALKLTHALDETALCSHITLLAQQIDTTEQPAASLGSAVSASGAVRPRALAQNISALFRKAARVWLLSLVPGMTRASPALANLVAQFAELLTLVPTGPGGFDRSIVWPLLMAGAHAAPDATLREAIDGRVASMGEVAETGSFGRMRVLLAEVWAVNDAADAAAAVEAEGAAGVEGGQEAGARASSNSAHAGVHWRDVMQQRGWDFLLL